MVSFSKVNVFLLLVFLFFFTSAADLLHVEIIFLRAKLGHLIALCLGMFLFLQKKAIEIDKTLLLSFLFVLLSMGISAFYSPWETRSFTYVLVAILTFVLYFLIPYNLVELLGKDLVWKLYKTAFIVTASLSCVQVASSIVGWKSLFSSQILESSLSRGQALAYEPSYFALYMIPYVFYTNAKALFEGKAFLRLIIINGLLLVSTSTSAFFAYFIFGAVVLFIEPFFREKLMGRLLKISCLFSGMFFLLFFFFQDFFLETFWKFFRKGFMGHHSFVERLEGIQRGWRVFCEHPWFGVGVGGMDPTAYLDVYGGKEPFFLNNPTVEQFKEFEPTNVGTEILSSLGIVGTCFLLGFFLIYFRRILSPFALKNLPQEERGELYALFVSILVMLIVLQFNQNLFRSYVWIHLGFSLGVASEIQKKYVIFLGGAHA